MSDALRRLARAAKAGAIPGGSIEDGVLKIDRLTAAVPEEAEAVVLDLYGRLPGIRITDLLLEVDDDIGFTSNLIGGLHASGDRGPNWPDILRSAAAMLTGVMPPSQLLRKFASCPRQHGLAVALREIGRVERTLFIINWLLMPTWHAPRPDRTQQGRSPSRPQKCPAHRTPGRNP